MLDPWIIEEIRRREEEQRQRDEQRSRIDIQIETPPDADRSGARPGMDRDRSRPKVERGVTIIDFSI